MNLYEVYNTIPEQPLTLTIYKIFNYIERWFWFMNYCKNFSINILSSKTLLKRRIVQFIRQSKDRILPRTRTIN